MLERFPALLSRISAARLSGIFSVVAVGCREACTAPWHDFIACALIELHRLPLQLISSTDFPLSLTTTSSDVAAEEPHRHVRSSQDGVANTDPEAGSAGLIAIRWNVSSISIAITAGTLPL